MDDKEKLTLRFKVSSVFTPTSPIDKYDLFAGRKDEVNKIFSAVAQKGEHAIIYGERGVGKTSLANVLTEFLKGLGLKHLTSVRVNCDVRTSFSELWTRIFRELQISEVTENDETQLPLVLEKRISPDDVRYTLKGLPSQTIIIIDEIDRVKDAQTTALLADVIKALSDHSVQATLVLVGVADSVNEIIADHKSIGRALVQIHMPLMSASELSEILNKALGQVGMTIDEVASYRITALSQGLPHYTHLLGLLAAEHAIDQGRLAVAWMDVQEAVKQAIDKTNQSNVDSYLRATGSPQKANLYSYILLACALTPTDELGRFSAADIRNPLSEIRGKPYRIPAFARHLNDFCREDRGSILQRSGQPRRYKYRFKDPQMRPFVTMQGLGRKYITEETWRKLSGMH